MNKLTKALVSIGIVSTFLCVTGCSTDIQTSRPQPKQQSSLNSVTRTGQPDAKMTKKAEQDNSANITLEQLSKVKQEMTYEEVKNILGMEGHMVSESGEKGTPRYSVIYIWKLKDLQSIVQITFLDGKVRGIYKAPIPKA
ncbi:hypothetical protein [Ectobacillus panaciterrae]|uniref:hypothetical protein n=1 Tax=Ectobacillus panaciterrae TaxID=363872 RepID=UPI0004273D06|nr:hypothetical protein [Ectobacillus panaciterrae]